MKNNQIKDQNFSVTYDSISKYLEQEYDGFLTSVVGRIRTLDYVRFEENIKYKMEIPVVNSTVAFVADTGTTFSNTNTTAVSKVELTPVQLKSEESFNIQTMKQFWAGKYFRSDKELPFEEAFMAEKYQKIAKKVDQIYWQGGNGHTSVITTATSSGAYTLSSQSFAVSTGLTNGIVATFDNMADNRNSDLLGEEMVLFCSTENFNRYTRAIRNLNLYHYSDKELQGGVCSLVGYDNITVVATVGLDGVNQALLIKPDYLLWGCDIKPDGRSMDSEYNFVMDQYLIRYRIDLCGGVAFADKAVVAK